MLNNAYNDNETSPRKSGEIARAAKARQQQLMALRADVSAILKAPQSLIGKDDCTDTCRHPSTFFDGCPAQQLHELWAARSSDHAAVTAFALAVAKESEKPILWVASTAIIREQGLPYAPGLLHMGLKPETLILIRTATGKDALWALEEGIKADAFSLVVGELEDISLKNSQRLSIALQAHNTKGILLMRNTQEPQSAAYSRRRITPEPSAQHPALSNAVTESHVKVQALKHRAGIKPHAFSMEWNHETHRFDLVSPLGDGSVAEATATPRSRQA